MFHDVFDDPGVRKAFEESLGVRAHAFGNEPGHPQWYFERVRYGLRRVELAPLGLYSAVSGNDGQYRDLCSFIEGVGRPKAATVRINVNPLETRADELAKHAESLGFSVVQHQTHMLPIRASIEAMRSNYHSTRRYEALRDTGAQSVIHLASAPSHLEDYFAVYAASLKRWGLQRFIYPRTLFAALMHCPSVRIWLNYVEGRLACAMVVFYCRTYALYWQGVSSIDADQKAAYPTVKLMDAVLQDLIGSGVGHLNFGASDGLPNVRKFKESFGASPMTYPSLLLESRLWRFITRSRRLLRGRTK